MLYLEQPHITIMELTAKQAKHTKHACYFAYLAMSSIFSLPPLLFNTFRAMYGISYTLLGTLVLINFCTQLTVDLIFTFFTKYFNPHKTVRIMPCLTTLGLLVYALIPTLFPQIAYVGFVAGTVIFSIAAGLCEVMLSPTVAALPSDNPDRDMSMLHSLYGWGVLMVIVISTLFLRIFGTEYWMVLTLFWAMLPIASCVLFCTSKLPEMDLTSQSDSAEAAKKKNLGLALCVACIFLGSAAENAMTNWISGYMETALHLPKVIGDILGMAAFAMLLVLARTLYAKYGKNITAILLYSMIGAVICYLVAALSPFVVVSMIACMLTGFVTSMLWPGTLILMEEKIPNPGVTAYALMAAGGDFGASVAPQMLGIITDNVAASNWAAQLSANLSLTPDEIGMKVGMIAAAVFPLIGIAVVLYIKRYFAKAKETI